MSSSITVSFKINDLDSSYQIIGTSDNYSFKEDAGYGYDLVTSEGEEFSKAIPLNGNYGKFNIRVVAISQIGIQSSAIIDSIEVLPKEFENTFTFASISSSNANFENLESSVIYSPTFDGDKLEVNSEFAGKEFNLNWSLIPPAGHPLEGEVVSTELLSDTFFSGFRINIKQDGELLDLNALGFSSNSLDTLANTFETDAGNVAEILDNYRDFYLNFNSQVFNDLNLSRDLQIEVVAVDRFAREATGIINLNNPAPKLNSLSYSLDGSSANFSWSSEDVDFSSVDIEVLAVPDSVDLYDPRDLSLSASHLQELKKAKPYSKYEGAYYQQSDKVYYGDNIYESARNHNRIKNETPDNSENWINLGPQIDFKYFKSNSESSVRSDSNLIQDSSIGSNYLEDSENYFSVSQMWNYKYYYTFKPSDRYGPGSLYNLTENGLVEYGADGSDLYGVASNIYVSNLRFRESSDDIVFNWEITDQDGNFVDIAQYKYIFSENDIPSVLGISGSLFDVHTKEKIYEITKGNNSKGLEYDDDGDLVLNSSLPSTKIFEQFKYTRELNNSIYKNGGFPRDYKDYDSSDSFNQGDIVNLNNKLYSAYQNIDQFGVKPVYEDWDKSKTYYSESSDQFIFNRNIYKCVKDFGPDSKNFAGLFVEGEAFDLDDIVLSVEQEILIFESTKSYSKGDFVFYNKSIFECIQALSETENADPNNENFWKRLDVFSDLQSSFFRSLVAGNIYSPLSRPDLWKKIDPEILSLEGNFFEKIVSHYQYNVSNWDSDASYSQGSIAIYGNQLWSGVKDGQGQIPSNESDFWSNISSSSTYQEGDLVYSNNFVYRCDQDDPVAGPIEADVNKGDDILSDYESTNWIPFWELNSQYDDVIFGNVGIPQSGKRGVGIELGIVDNQGELVNRVDLIANNPPPYILSSSFNVDSTSQATKVNFNFNYALGFQEKTTKLYLYRAPANDPVNPVELYNDQGEITGYNFDITDEFGFPDTGDKGFFVKSVIGAGDATFGQNITQISDSPPVLVDENGVEQITGYYYKLLPFDDFGSGVVFEVDNNGGLLEKVLVYPSRYNNSNPNVNPGRVLRSDPTATTDRVPSGVRDFSGTTSFENFFLTWKAPSLSEQFVVQANNLSTDFETDIDYYEVWVSSDNVIKTGLNLEWYSSQNTGYRKIEGVMYDAVSHDFDIPKEFPDPAIHVSNARNEFNVPANTPIIETVYPAKTNDPKNFWVRAVDHAGNKSPFVGNSGNNEYVEGLKLKAGKASATDLADFEINMTETFSNTMASVPINPFETDGDGGLIWDEHVVYTNTTGYIVSGDSLSKTHSFVWWDIKDENGDSLNILRDNAYVNFYEFNEDSGKEEIKTRKYNGQQIEELVPFETGGLKNVYFSGIKYSGSISHPAGSSNSDDVNGYIEPISSFNDGDFIIARNNGGVPTIANHAFANALIGTANIADAAIIDAKIKNLKVDKLLAGEISSADIQLTQNAAGGNVASAGVIRSAGFTGITDTRQSGFYISGDGSFAFQQGLGALAFEDDELVLYGKLRTKEKRGYDFIDLDITPNFFSYQEVDGEVFVPNDAIDKVDITARFRNTDVTIDSANIRFKVEAVEGPQRYPVVEYGNCDENGHYNISGLFYGPGPGGEYNHIEQGIDYIQAKATFSLDGFDEILSFHDHAETIVITVTSLDSSVERSASISRIIDGKVGDHGLTPTFKGEWSAGEIYTFVPSTISDPGRGDIVKFSKTHPVRQLYGSADNVNSNYFIAHKSQNNQGQAPVKLNSDSQIYEVNSDYWLEFGAELANVATALLLTEEAIITEKLTMGTTHPSIDNPNSGVIVSNGFVGGFLDTRSDNYLSVSEDDYNNPGFLLTKTSNGVIFDVGGSGVLPGNDTYIRFSSQKKSIEIKGAFINNNTIDESLVFDKEFNSNVISDSTFSNFIGGGYNNQIIPGQDGVDEDNVNVGSSILGGAWNKIQGRFSSILGGYGGECYDNFSSIIAGYGNKMPQNEDGDYQGGNMIGAGLNNTIDGGGNQTILGGGGNKLNGFVGGYMPIFDEYNDKFSTKLFGFADYNSNDLTDSGWWSGSWLGAMFLGSGGDNHTYNFRTPITNSWIYSANLEWVYVPGSTDYCYLDNTKDIIWVWITDMRIKLRQVAGTGFPQGDTFDVSGKWWAFLNPHSESSNQLFKLDIADGGSTDDQYLYLYSLVTMTNQSTGQSENLWATMSTLTLAGNDTDNTNTPDANGEKDEQRVLRIMFRNPNKSTGASDSWFGGFRL